MRGALLVLALLVTRELTFKTTEVEACPAFFEAFNAVVLALPSKVLNETLDAVDANEDEKAAAEKIRLCFLEAGPVNRLNNLRFKASVILDNDCIGYKLSSVVNIVVALFSNLVTLVL